MVLSPLQLRGVVSGSSEDKVVRGMLSQPYKTPRMINNRQRLTVQARDGDSLPIRSQLGNLMVYFSALAFVSCFVTLL